MLSNEDANAKQHNGSSLHRPDEDIPNRPRLRVKRRRDGEGTAESAGEPASQPAPPAPNVEPANSETPPPAFGDSDSGGETHEGADQEHPPAGQESGEKPLPRIDPNRGPSPYATHRPAPANEEAEQQELAAVAGQEESPRQVSTGFLLGIALIVVALLGGVFIVRLQQKVNALEQRLEALETGAGVSGQQAPGD